MSMVFLYKNLIKNTNQIIANSMESGYGSSALFDDDINSPYRGTATVIGTTIVFFDFGSSVYVDSAACVSNIPVNGSFKLMAGTTNPCLDFSILPALNVSGTFYKDIGLQNYRYWGVQMHGQTGNGRHQINELFLGKRKVVTELPSYPIETGVEEDVSELVSERGQKWVYTNFNREYWVFNFEGVNATTEADLYNMYKSCGKNTTPFWMIVDVENDPQNIKFCRFKDRSFLSNEITKNIYDVTVEIERDL